MAQTWTPPFKKPASPNRKPFKDITEDIVCPKKSMPTSLLFNTSTQKRSTLNMIRWMPLFLHRLHLIRFNSKSWFFIASILGNLTYNSRKITKRFEEEWYKSKSNELGSNWDPINTENADNAIIIPLNSNRPIHFRIPRWKPSHIEAMTSLWHEDTIGDVLEIFVSAG